MKSDQFYGNEIKLQKQQLHLQSLKNKGLDEEYARQKAIYDIQNRGLEVNEEAIRRQLALQRANADERFKGDQNKRAEDLKFQAEQKLRTRSSRQSRRPCTLPRRLKKRPAAVH